MPVNKQDYDSCSLYFSPEKMRLIKESLVSRSETEILGAVESLMQYVDDEQILDKIMKSDVPVLLSEAILPGRTESNSSVYQCLRAMCSHKSFYTDGHAFIVSQGACRSAAFLINSPEENSELDTVLLLLADILAGYEIFRIAPDRMLLLQLNDFLVTLTSTKIEIVNTRYFRAVLVNALLEVQNVKFRPANLRFLLDSLFRCFHDMAGLVQQLIMDPVVDRIVAVTCSLAAHLCNFAYPKDGSEGLMDPAVKQTAVTQVSSFVVKQAVPHVLSTPLVQFEADPSRVTALFQCMVKLLEGPCEESNKLAQELGAAKVLSLVPTVLCYSEAWQNGNLKTLSRQLLWRLLTSLSLDVFRYPEMWEEGEEHFLREVECGVVALPPDPSHWLPRLGDPLTHRSVKLVVLLFLYFQVLVEGSLTEVNTYVAVVRFMKELSDTGSRAIVIKIVWLILALSQVNGSSVEAEEDHGDAILKLSTLLDGHEHLDLVYTHHPTILFYAFSSPHFPSALQSHVMRLWLTNQSESEDADVAEFLRTSETAKFTVLDLVQSGEGKVADKAFQAYRSLLLDTDMDKEADVVWRLLPNVLAKVCAATVSEDNLVKVIELTMIRLPESRDHHDESRAAALLPAAVSALLEPPLPVWRLAHRLLTFRIEKADFQAVACYMQSATFVQKLLDSLSSRCPDTAQFCLKIAACLNSIQRREDVPEVAVRVKLDVVPVLRQLVAPQAQVRYAALLFLHELLEAKWEPPLCDLGGPPAPDLIRLVFFFLQNASMQDRSDECWECLSSFLQLYPVEDPMAAHFIHSHWLLHVIENSLPCLSESSAMLSFTETWYGMRRPRTPSSGSLAAPLECITVALIAEQIVKSFQPSMLPLLVKIYESEEIMDPMLQDAVGKLVQNRLHSQMDVSATILAQDFPENDDGGPAHLIQHGEHTQTQDGGLTQIQHDTITIESDVPSTQCYSQARSNPIPKFEQNIFDDLNPQILTQRNTQVQNFDLDLFEVRSAQNAPGDFLHHAQNNQAAGFKSPINSIETLSIQTIQKTPKINRKSLANLTQNVNRASGKKVFEMNPTGHLNQNNARINLTSRSESFQIMTQKNTQMSQASQSYQVKSIQNVTQKNSKMMQYSQSESFLLNSTQSMNQTNLDVNRTSRNTTLQVNLPQNRGQNNLKSNQMFLTQNLTQKPVQDENGLFQSLNVNPMKKSNLKKKQIPTVVPSQTFSSQVVKKNLIYSPQRSNTVTVKNAASQPKDPFEFTEPEMILNQGNETAKFQDLHSQKKRSDILDLFPAPCVSQAKAKETSKPPLGKNVIRKPQKNNHTSKFTVNSLNFAEKLNEDNGQNIQVSKNFSDTVDLTESLTHSRGISLAHSPQTDLFENENEIRILSSSPLMETEQTEQPSLSHQRKFDATGNSGRNLNCEELYDKFFGASSVPTFSQK